MKKRVNNKSITISKKAFLDEMLPFPSLESDHDYDTLNTTYTLEIPYKFEELIKTIASKTLSEEELIEVLGNSKNGWWGETVEYSI